MHPVYIWHLAKKRVIREKDKVDGASPMVTGMRKSRLGYAREKIPHQLCPVHRNADQLTRALSLSPSLSPAHQQQHKGIPLFPPSRLSFLVSRCVNAWMHHGFVRDFVSVWRFSIDIAIAPASHLLVPREQIWRFSYELPFSVHALFPLASLLRVRFCPLPVSRVRSES